jgi:hypothetical protein
MIGLLIYAAMFAAVIAGAWAFIASHDKGVRDEQMAKDQIVLNAVIADRKTAVDANLKLQADLAVLDGERQACSDSVLAIKAESDRRAAQRVVRKPAQDEKLAKIAADKFALIVAMGQPDKGGTCEAQMAANDALLRDVADKRLLLYPAADGNVVSDKPAAAAGGGVNSVPVRR